MAIGVEPSAPGSRLARAAEAVIRDLVGLQEGEEVLIVTNPGTDVFTISSALYESTKKLGGRPAMLIAPTKESHFEHGDRLIEEITGAIPDVILLLADGDMGRDPYGLNLGYLGRDGNLYHNTCMRLQEGDRRIRYVESFQPTIDLFERYVPIDYRAMQATAQQLIKVLSDGDEIRVTSPAGTDALVSIRGRKVLADDGNWKLPGVHGNLPCGEVFLSPAIEGVSGTLVFDGTVTLDGTSELPDQPVTVQMKGGYVSSVTGGKTAKELLKVIEKGEQIAREKGLSELEKNARHIGELGIGLNENARVCGNLIEAVKALKTIHFAIGSNYEDDARAMIHLDCLMLRPSVWVDGMQIMKDGNLIL